VKYLIDIIDTNNEPNIINEIIDTMIEQEKAKGVPSVSREDIRPTKMATNPLQVIVSAGMRVINMADDNIYQHVGIGWIKERKAEPKDYLEIPQLAK
jgi:hypothetical protein